MKVIIIMRDLLTWPAAMAAKLHAEGHEIILLDNASTYQPLLDWYAHCPYRVIREANLGHLSPWAVLQGEMLDAPFVVTDPDLDLSNVPADWAEKALRAMEITGETKIGLMLDCSTVPEDSLMRGHKNPMNCFILDPAGTPVEGIPIVGMSVDTTFAVYAPGREPAIDGVCLGTPYTVVHLPWQMTPRTVNEEYRYYVEHASSSSQLSTLLRSERTLHA